jgi:hypothetical protein
VEVETVELHGALPARVAERIQEIACELHVSSDRAIVNLLQDAVDAYERRRAAFLEIAKRYQESSDPADTERLREELVRLTFGG